MSPWERGDAGDLSTAPTSHPSLLAFHPGDNANVRRLQWSGTWNCLGLFSEITPLFPLLGGREHWWPLTPVLSGLASWG